MRYFSLCGMASVFLHAASRAAAAAEKAYRRSLELAPDHLVAIAELAYIAKLRAGGRQMSAVSLQSNIAPAEVFRLSREGAKP